MKQPSKPARGCPVTPGAIASIEVPAEVRSGDYEVVLSLSGGKDSTAAALALREAGVPYRMVFADTQWEAPETYAHLDHLRERLGPIDVVGVPGGMVAKIEHRAGFPARMQRWCTRELKLKPLRDYHSALEESTGRESVCVVGIRSDESDSRAKMLPWEDDQTWEGWVWRPLLRWTVADVLAIHHRHGVEVNPLYKRGHNRVGCYPCIYAGKNEIALIAEHSPTRIDEIRRLEEMVVKVRAERNAVQPGRYVHPKGTFFQTRDRGAANSFQPIDTVVAWAKTAHGGRQNFLFPPPPDGGCFRWGMCEAPTPDE